MKDYFKNQIVRDLVWVIASPPLFEFLPSDPGIRFFGMDIFSEEYVALEKFIRQLDNNPESLADHIHLGNNRLLGKYYESLTEFWLMHSDRFHLIGRGTQVDGNGETLGEFDFILRDKKKDKFIHLETAGKFYISAGNSGEWNAFIGPNPNDSLQKKMDKLLNSQINLGRTKSGRTRLSEFGINEIDSAVMIKGYFFYHVKNFFRKNFNAPLYSFTNHNKGWWISVASSGTLAEIKAEKWTVLKRPRWISRAVIKQTDELLDIDLLLIHLNDYFKANNYPLLLASLRKKGPVFVESGRGFVVPDTWPDLKNIH